MSNPTSRNFAAELKAARDAQDWAAHERIWEERRIANVEHDEAMLSSPTEKEYQEAYALSSDANTSEEVASAYWQLVRQYRGQIFNRAEAEMALRVLRLPENGGTPQSEEV